MARAQDEASENHWPGYVDALTTMLMVLTFVMMILGIAVFAMSQNVSRIIVETIARAALIEPPIDDVPVPELTERILDKLRRHPPRPPVTASGPSLVEQPGPASAGPQRGMQGAGADEAAAPPLALGPGHRVVSGQRAAEPGEAGPVRSRLAGASLILEFQPRATQLDAAAAERLARTLADEAQFQSAAMIEVRASHDRAATGLTDARRIAYYRAMLVRSAILKTGIPADRIRVFVDQADTVAGGETSADLVRVIPLLSRT